MIKNSNSLCLKFFIYYWYYQSSYSIISVVVLWPQQWRHERRASSVVQVSHHRTLERGVVAGVSSASLPLAWVCRQLMEACACAGLPRRTLYLFLFIVVCVFCGRAWELILLVVFHEVVVLRFGIVVVERVVEDCACQ